ncbi:hypothetical protein CVN68_17710 [Sphingomonas psychrotolerans]|uniref:Transmembrane protein n=1 Tax=Sphingomonas psychrotolerans TaxID=1327635 RepID=A0A2K8MQ47_9SPHN|nr:hypothetical protein CVN68_17710 [Sphingomonas psychrotolerans]
MSNSTTFRLRLVMASALFVMAIFYVGIFLDGGLKEWIRIAITILMIFGLIGIIMRIKLAYYAGLLGVVLLWLFLLINALPDLREPVTRMEVYLRGLTITAVVSFWLWCLHSIRPRVIK